jgi:hypothetical protein
VAGRLLSAQVSVCLVQEHLAFGLAVEGGDCHVPALPARRVVPVVEGDVPLDAVVLDVHARHRTSLASARLRGTVAWPAAVVGRVRGCGDG